MPRKRKSLSASPQRRISILGSSLTPTASAAMSLPSAMSNNKENMLYRMCEMFPNLDLSLVEMVVCEYKEVDIVMDYLLELSTATKEKIQLESTGFHKIASFLDDFQVDSANMDHVPDQIEHHQNDLRMDGTLCDDLDTLLDEALDKYGLNNADNFFSAEQCEDSTSTMSNTIEMPELVQSTSIQNTSFHTEHTERIVQSQTDLERKDYHDELDLDAASCEYNIGTFSTSPSDVPNTTEMTKLEADSNEPPDMTSRSVNLGTSEEPVILHCTESLASTHSNVPLPWASPAFQIKWNPMASTFYPTTKPQHSFFTPVAALPAPWAYLGAARGSIGGMCYNPPGPSPCVWNFNRFPQTHRSTKNIKPISQPETRTQIGPQVSKKGARYVGEVLILLRGAPGSGKSTLARMLLEQNATGVILSTDDYFDRNGQYQYDVNCLGEAHEWNHKRAKDSFEKHVSPILIDNTNLQVWEMKPYVSMAMKYKYKVTFREPDTWWKYIPEELERRNTHGIKKEKIMKMLERFDCVTVNSILNLSRPERSERADVCRIIKPANKNGPRNILPPMSKEEETHLSKTPVTESENTSDMDVAITTSQKSLDSEIVKDCPEILLDDTKPVIQNLRNTDGENENRVDCSPDDFCLQEQAVDRHVPNCDSDSLPLSERPELLSFVGDWPVEQTMSQRAPRKKKAKPSHKMCNPPAQQPTEEEKTIDCNWDQIDKPIALDSFKESTILKTEWDTDFFTVNEDNICKLENQLCTSLTLMDKENGAPGAQKSDGTDVSEPSLVVKQVTEVIAINQDNLSVKEDVKIQPSPGKHNCRHCKLTLTFTNSCSSSAKEDETQCTCESPETIQQTSVGLCKSSQTEPHEFALAWRIEKKYMDIVDSIKVLTGKTNRFKPKSLDSGSDAQENIPYRVMHHKSTFVEEDEISSLGDEDSLNILCKLFRSLSFDVLKDLFERCNKDLVWATNLLLDSGEKMYKDEECQSEDCYRSGEEEFKRLESCGHSDEDNLHKSCELIDDNSLLIDKHSERSKTDDTSYKDSSVEASGNVTFVHTLPLVVAEELKHGNVLSNNVNATLNHQCRISTKLDSFLPNQETVNDTIAAPIMWPSDLERGLPNAPGSSIDIVATSNSLKGNTNKEDDTQELYYPNPNISQKAGVHQHEIPLVDNYEGQEMTAVDVVEEENKSQNNNNSGSRSKEPLQFDYLDLSLPPEFAFRLTELFGPVGIDTGSLTIKNCVVPIDLKLAESIHKRWKESIMERHNQEALSYQLMFEDFAENNPPNDHVILDDILQEQESRFVREHLTMSQGEMDRFPFMDQWNTRIKKVSLRQIMSEEMALQAHEDLKKPLSRKNCAVKLKEKHLLKLFPHIEEKLLMDVFKENNYSLEKSEQFMNSVLEADPVQNVVAPGKKPAASSVTDKTKEKKVKADKEILNERSFQDLEQPDYDDFRAEAFLYHRMQQESYRKAAEAHNGGMKQVGAYYAQQGYLYGQKVKEENHRAAVKIFKRANEYLLPENILDLHGLHVDEAMKHFRKMLQDKTEEFKQHGGKPHLLVITGRGNHSHSGVPRIKPAISDYLTSHDYRLCIHVELVSRESVCLHCAMPAPILAGLF